MTQNKPLSEDELREKISTLSVDGHQLQNYLGSQHVDKLVDLIIQDRKAWGEYVLQSKGGDDTLEPCKDHKKNGDQ